MGSSVDIDQVISRGTSQVALSDLSRKGFKKVRVVNQSAITRLIAEAVDTVMAKRASEISAAERRKVIDESQRQFEHLARERLQRERSRIGNLQSTNSALEEEIRTLKARLAGFAEVQAARDQAETRVREVEETSTRLAGRLSEKEKEVTVLRVELEAVRESTLCRDGDLERQNESLHQVQSQLLERDRHVAKLEGELAAKNEEIQRLSSGGDDRIEQFIASVGERLEKAGSSAEMKDIKESLVGLKRNLLSIASGSAAKVGDTEGLDDTALVQLAQKAGDVEVESNVNEVKVKQAKSRGVRSSLAKLREMQKKE